MISLPEGIRAPFAEEIPAMPVKCIHPDHGPDAHKHVGIGERWFYKPAETTNPTQETKP